MIPTILMRLFSVGCILMTTPVFAGESSTSYWYGGDLHPLVIERDGITYRLIGKGVVEALAGSQPTRSYAHADHLGSVRMITDDAGSVFQSLSYNDYGSTRIAGESTAATDDSVASFYRFQGQEQEVFPLARLDIDDPSLAAWLDQIEFYHFPWRDYAAGLAAFTQTDPVPTEDSLYSAFAANPINVIDETGGMINADAYFPLRYNPAHRIIAPRLQTLLEQLEIDHNVLLTWQEILDLRRLQLAIYSQRTNPNNPFEPDHWTLGEYNRRSNSYLKTFVPITEERVRQAEQDFVDLRREQDDWLNRYSAIIADRWYRQRSRAFGSRRPMEAHDEEDEKNKTELEQSATQNQDANEDVNDAPVSSTAVDGNDGLLQQDQQEEELEQKEQPDQASEPIASERNRPDNEKPCCNIL